MKGDFDLQKACEGLSNTLMSEGFVKSLLETRRGMEKSDGGGGEVEDALVAGAKDLFAAIEGMLGPKFKSDLPELYTDGMDGESIWAQVDIMNGGILRDMKKALRSLSKSSESGERAILFASDGASEEGASDVRDSEEDTEGEGDDDGEEVDEQAERVRKRMERAMAAMDADSDGELSSSSSVDRSCPQEGEEDDVEVEDEDEEGEEGEEGEQGLDDDGDPMGNDMRDGFFDVNDMEGFADEEEELHYGIDYEDVYDEGGSDDSGDEGTRASSKTEKRKKFRGDDEMNVLAKLYQNDGLDDNVDEDDLDEDEEEPTAEDFFGKPSLRVVERYKEKHDRNFSARAAAAADEAPEDSDGGDEEEPKESKSSSSTRKAEPPPGNSSHKAKSTKLLKQTEAMEEEALAEKPWTMVGEVTGGARPVDSLLQAAPEFEQASKLAPTINLEHTENLEEVIKRRILAEDWDDVLPRELPSIRTSRGGEGNAPEISQEKSKLGLGEIYERDYLKKAVGYDVEASEKESAEELAKAEMKALFAKLCSRLDALSNYHFSPRPVEEEAEVKNLAAPAIAMEEVMPLTVSDARASAPEEVFSGKRGRESVLKGDSELNQEDRKRLRATKKQARRKERKQRNADEKLISRLKPGLGLNNPYEARKLKEDLSKARSLGNVVDAKEDTNKDYNTSTQFFARMQQQVKNDIQGGAGTDNSSAPAEYGKKRGKGNKAAELLL